MNAGTEVMCVESGPGVEWLIEKFDLDLSLVARLGGHSQPRTHRGAERFPGMTITYALMQRFEKIAETSDRARIVNKARVRKPDYASISSNSSTTPRDSFKHTR